MSSNGRWVIEAENDVEMTCQCCEVGSFIVSGRLDCDHCTISGIYITRLGPGPVLAGVTSWPDDNYYRGEESEESDLMFL